MFTDALTLVEEDCAVFGWFVWAGCCALVLVFGVPLGVCWAWLFAGAGLLVCA
jgi:hypothetical protein